MWKLAVLAVMQCLGALATIATPGSLAGLTPCGLLKGTLTEAGILAICVNSTILQSHQLSAGDFELQVATIKCNSAEIDNSRVDVALVASSATGNDACESLSPPPGVQPLDGSPRWSADLFANLTAPLALQGHDDHLMAWVLASDGGIPAVLSRAEYIRDHMQPGVRRYNLFWSAIEASNVPASDQPQTACPAQFVAVPATELQRSRRGFHRFHCYHTPTIQNQDVYLAADTLIGSLSGAILYGAPDWAISPNCTGFEREGVDLRLGCVPLPEYRADWEDYVNYIMWRYNGAALNHSTRDGMIPDFDAAVLNASLPVPNKLSLAVIWNEIASMAWDDPSPLLPNRWAGPGTNYTDPQIDLLAAEQSELVLRAERAMRRQLIGAALASPEGSLGPNADGAVGGGLVLVSFDHFWWVKPGVAPLAKAGAVDHVGDMRLLRAMWPYLGAGTAWGVAVHPYDGGDPRADLSGQGIFTFATLGKMVGSFQKGQIAAVGNVGATGAGMRPQSLMWASEQGWRFESKTMNDTTRARNVCFAQELSQAQGLFAVTHNYFQESFLGPHGNLTGQFGLIPPPPLVHSNFSNGPGHPTFDAYIATSPLQWQKDKSNYCCVTWTVGCPP